MGNRGPQKTVREGQFNRALDAMNYEMAGKTAASLGKFHESYVAPLESRIYRLELILGVRLWLWVRGKVLDGWHNFYMKNSDPIEEVSVEEPEPEVAPEPAPQPEDDGVSRILSL